MSDLDRIIAGGQLCGSAVAMAIFTGKIKKASEYKCVDCGNRARDYDHRDYNHPLAIDPVCRGCNKRRGKAIPKRWENGALLERMKRECNRRHWDIDRVMETCERVEKITGIPKRVLRPDLFK